MSSDESYVRWPRQAESADRVRLGTIATIASAPIMPFTLTGFRFSTDYSRVIAAGAFPDVLHECATSSDREIGPIAEESRPRLG